MQLDDLNSVALPHAVGILRTFRKYGRCAVAIAVPDDATAIAVDFLQSAGEIFIEPWLDDSGLQIQDAYMIHPLNFTSKEG